MKLGQLLLKSLQRSRSTPLKKRRSKGPGFQLRSQKTLSTQASLKKPLTTKFPKKRKTAALSIRFSALYQAPLEQPEQQESPKSLVSTPIQPSEQNLSGEVSAFSPDRAPHFSGEVALGDNRSDGSSDESAKAVGLEGSAIRSEGPEGSERADAALDLAGEVSKTPLKTAALSEAPAESLPEQAPEPQVEPYSEPQARPPAVQAEPHPHLPVRQTDSDDELQEIEVISAPRNKLTTRDLVRPRDQLKQSIEGFLLDQRSPHTQRAYGKDLKRFIQFLHSRQLAYGLEDLNRTILIAYKEMLLADGLEHTSIDRHLATLRSFFRWLVDDGVIEKNPAEGVRFMNPKRMSRTVGFSDEEVRKILQLPNLHTRTGAQHYAILMVLFYCGLRRSELCSIKTSHFSVEREHQILRLRGKGNAERIVVLTPPVWKAIQHYLLISRRSLSGDHYLFTPIRNNRTGVMEKPMDPSMIFYIVTKYAKEAGITHRVSPHSCRATAISNARDHQVPDRAIQEFAGWASPDMITRYDKRKSAVEKSAAHAIVYGAENRPLPFVAVSPSSSSASATSSAGISHAQITNEKQLLDTLQKLAERKQKSTKPEEPELG